MRAITRASRAIVARVLSSLVVVGLVIVGVPLSPDPVLAASPVTAAIAGGGSGTYLGGTTWFAKNGGALTLTVTTTQPANCVTVSGYGNIPTQTSGSGKTSWTFGFSAGTGNGQQTLTASAYNNTSCSPNQNGKIGPAFGRPLGAGSGSGPFVTLYAAGRNPCAFAARCRQRCA